jgi:hypothetical protein
MLYLKVKWEMAIDVLMALRLIVLKGGVTIVSCHSSGLHDGRPEHARCVPNV